MRRTLSSRLAIAMGAVLIAVPLPAIACSPSTPIQVKLEGPPPSFKAECRAAWRGRDKLLADLASGEQSFWDYNHIAHALREGTNECRKRPSFALAMVDAALGTPFQPWSGAAPTSQFLEWQDESISQERVQEVVIGSWLLGRARRVTPLWNWCAPGYYADEVPAGVTREKLADYFANDQYWTRIRERFGHNPGRDRLVLRELIDPSSVRFDLKLAAELAPKFYEGDKPRGLMPILVDVAEALANSALGGPDYEAARQVLEWYSPYTPNGLDDGASARAQALLERITQARLTHPDAQVRRDARVAIEAGDPHAKAGPSFEEALGEGVKVRILDTRPDSLPPFQRFERTIERIANYYPRRALRTWRGGRVGLGMLFNPDGSFHSVHIMRSAGPTLDDAAKRGLRRYLRPRLSQTRLTGFEGQHVYVPLPSFEYRIAFEPPEDFDAFEAGSEDDTITIVGELRTPRGY